jgi:hypothetical protein
MILSRGSDLGRIFDDPEQAWALKPNIEESEASLSAKPSRAGVSAAVP